MSIHNVWNGRKYSDVTISAAMFVGFPPCLRKTLGFRPLFTFIISDLLMGLMFRALANLNFEKATRVAPAFKSYASIGSYVIDPLPLAVNL